jgi:hypothetical protein
MLIANRCYTREGDSTMTALPSTSTGCSPGSGRARLWRRWIAATTLGELLGFLAPALVGVLVVGATAEIATPLGPLLLLIGLVVAGSLEGAALGFAQWLALRQALPALVWHHWTGATALAGAVAWSLGMLPPTLTDLFALDPVAQIGAWLVVAPGLLLSIGVAQWLVLRHHLPQAGGWIPANALGWTLGVGLTFLGASLVTEAMPLWMAIAIGVTSGTAMGFVVGVITGRALVGLLGHVEAAERP